MFDREERLREVAREDLVLFVNACYACTQQTEFYGAGTDQAVSIRFLHDYVLGNYRVLYARTAATGINHFNLGEIVFHLLRTGRETPDWFRQEENAIVRAALRALPPQRALRVFRRLRAERVNNRRTRATIRDYLRDRRDPVFDAVKYRTKVRSAARHARLRLPGELNQFLFQGLEVRAFQTPLLEQFRQAHYSREKVYQLPFTVAEGLAAKHGIPRKTFLKRIQGHMTQEERLRQQGSAERTPGVRVEVELGRTRLTKLALYALSLEVEEREARRGELCTALDQSARRALRRSPLTLGRVAAVLDRSYSSSGSSEKRRRPLGVALGCDALLRAASREYRAFWTPGCDDALQVAARGSTDLAGPLIDALEWAPELVVIVSDGFENDPPGGAAEVLRAFRESLGRRQPVSVVHANPVFDAGDYVPRELGEGIPTVGLRSAEDLPTMLSFARFVDRATDLEELEAYLLEQVEGWAL